MSENENENVTQGNGAAGWGWEPVPQGGEYDSDATAFVKLPQDMLDALGTGEPLAAPGHGYVPPPMIVPLGSASTDPAATGTWTIPVQWPEAGGGASASGAGAGSGAASGPASGPASGSVGGPIPASIPIPASVAAAFAESDPEAEPAHDPGATAEWRFPEGVHEPEEAPSTTGRWAVPDFAQQQDFPQQDSAQQGDYRTGGGLDADWSQAPATLPGGAPAPWAYLTQQPAAEPDPGPGRTHGQDAGVLPGTDEAAAASAAAAATAHAAGRLLGGPGVGAASRGPRVLGGPGVGTALQEAEPAHRAPRDIEAAHGPAATAHAGERPHPGAAAQEPPASAGGVDLFGGARVEASAEDAEQPAEDAEHSARPGRSGHAEHGEPSDLFGNSGHTGHTGRTGLVGHAGHAEHGEQSDPFGHAGHSGHAAQTGHSDHSDHSDRSAHSAHFAHSERPADTDGHGFAAFGQASEPEAEAAPADGHGFADPGRAPAPDHADTDGQAPAEAAPDLAEVPAGSAPDADSADSAAELPSRATGEGIPARVPAYEGGTGPDAVVHHEHPHASYVLRVNGADRPVTGAWIGESLLYVLRERLGLAGAKDGCSQGECGACAVQVDGRLVASCLVPAATAAGSEVRTVEGLAAGGELSDVQQALCRSGAVQCGFCVPGMAMTIHDLLEGNHAPSELETRQALCGNLCRCSGYAGVVEAVREVVAGREAASAASADSAQGQAQGQAQGHVQAQGEAAPEPRIPHQAAPGEGGIHHGGTA
ncbi:2Fe-2S iron-sulfur cluster-binding protein [Streptomyces erythrochromogenes]|uniref:2Fe-2S iron-sulfur cluster-binding protein n=1 Tax=Streptomyces erythrochromogenes TaxID=285574 RepID=UPI003448A6E7